MYVDRRKHTNQLYTVDVLLFLLFYQMLLGFYTEIRDNRPTPIDPFPRETSCH